MGKLQLVSTGAGGSRYLTNEAIVAIREADLVVGYTKYIKDLNKMVTYLNENMDATVEVGGHTDSRGSKRYKLKV